MSLLKDDIPNGFENPVVLPRDIEQERHWQEANRTWWEKHPMRYDWQDKINISEFTKEFYLEIDKRVFELVRESLPGEKVPFESLIDFATLKNKDVLEIGVGNGSHAQLLTHFAKSFTGIDITNYAVKSTSERMKCFGLNGRIFLMDAEKMNFEDNTFDFIWSWGVIHHSADTRKVLSEMNRVLRPGGQAVVMVYYRSFWSYYLVRGVLIGILLGDLFKTKSLHKTAQRWTDGALARFYSIPEWRSLCSELFNVLEIRVLGLKSDLVLMPAGAIKKFIKQLIPDQASNYLLSRCRMGSFLVSILEKRR